MKLDRRGRWLAVGLGITLAVGLALRLALLIGQRSDILFTHPVLDEQRYVDAARAWAAGGAFEARPFWQPPGILFVLGATFYLFGPGLLVPHLVWALAGTLAALLVFLLGRRLFSARVALAAAAIVSLHGVLIFESYELLPPTLILLFDLLALLLLEVARDRSSRRWSFAAGLALGTAALFSPVILPFVAVAALLLRRASLIALLLLGTILPIAPVTLRNLRFERDPVLISSNGGFNFFLGNNPDPAETLALRPGRHYEELTSEPERHGIANAAGASSYFFHQGLAFLAHHPGRALAGYGRKLYLFVSGGEIPRDTDLYAARQGSPVLRVLLFRGPPFFPDGLLLPLALLGALLLFSEWRRLALLYAFVVTQALTLSAFFITARYRVPALAIFTLFAAAGAARLLERTCQTTGARRLLPFAALALLGVLLNLPTRESQVSYAAELDFYRGLAWAPRDPARAIDFFERSIAADPRDPRALFELGNALAQAGRLPDAVAAWRRAAALDPWDVRPRRRISVVLARAGDLDGAIAAISANVETRLREPSAYAPDHLNLAFLYARKGDLPHAAHELTLAASADPSFTRDKLPRLLEAALGDPAFADVHFWLASAEVAHSLGLAPLERTALLRARALTTDPALLHTIDSRLN